MILNPSAVMGASQVGQSVGQQIQVLAEQAKTELSAEAKQLQSEGAAIAKLPEAERATRAAAFAPRQDAFRQRAQQREAQVRGAFAKAQTEISKVLEPILRQVTTAHSANLVLDRRATAGLADTSLDVTAEVVEQLNAKMPSYKVTLADAAGNAGPGQADAAAARSKLISVTRSNGSAAFRTSELVRVSGWHSFPPGQGAISHAEHCRSASQSSSRHDSSP